MEESIIGIAEGCWDSEDGLVFGFWLFHKKKGKEGEWENRA